MKIVGVVLETDDWPEMPAGAREALRKLQEDLVFFYDIDILSQKVIMTLDCFEDTLRPLVKRYVEGGEDVHSVALRLQEYTARYDSLMSLARYALDRHGVDIKLPPWVRVFQTDLEGSTKRIADMLNRGSSYEDCYKYVAGVAANFHDETPQRPN